MLASAFPPSSFVPFSVHKLVIPKIVWSRAHAEAEAFLLRFAYCNPLPGDPMTKFSGERKVFYSDRYGGAGMLSNGGGARCGSNDGMQVKGIGKTPLAGKKTPFWHSHGGESVAGSIRDAIWGEVCDAALPFGAVRVEGIIETGTTVPAFTATDGAVELEARGLTVRPFSVRPGHFIRALQFTRQDEQRALLAPDADRTRCAVKHAPRLFQEIFQSEPLKLSEALPIMVTRFAAQLAAANAKKIVHGAICASNICIDGKWIDFGTASTVSDYGKIKIGDTLPDAWSLDDSHMVIRDLVFYLQRYLPAEDRRDVPPPTVLLSLFDIVLQERRMWEFLKLTGISESALARQPKADLRELYAHCLNVMGSGNSEPFQLYGGRHRSDVEMPSVMGDFHLPSIMVNMALSPCQTTTR